MQHSHDAQTPDSFLRLNQCLEIFPVSRSEWWAGVKSGKYPKAYKISPRVTVWLRSEIEILIQQIKARGCNS